MVKKEVVLLGSVTSIPIVSAQPSTADLISVGSFILIVVLMFGVAHLIHRWKKVDEEFLPPPPPIKPIHYEEEHSDKDFVQGRKEIEHAIKKLHRDHPSSTSEDVQLPTTEDVLKYEKEAFIHTGTDPVGFLFTHIEMARQLLKDGHEKAAQEEYIKIVQVYNSLDNMQKAMVYKDVSQLYKERKATHK